MIEFLTKEKERLKEQEKEIADHLVNVKKRVLFILFLSERFGKILIFVSTLLMFYANMKVFMFWGEEETRTLINSYTQNIELWLIAMAICALGFLLYSIPMKEMLCTLCFPLLAPVLFFIAIAVLTLVFLIIVALIDSMLVLFTGSYPISTFLEYIIL